MDNNHSSESNRGFGGQNSGPNGDFGMDFEASPVQEEKRFAFSVEGDMMQRRAIGLHASSAQTEFADVDTYGENTDRSVTTTSQDTGYNTNSLQLSNPEVQFSSAMGSLPRTRSSLLCQENTSSTSMIAHTDLTAQFSSMPISGGPSMDISEGYDSGDELGTSSGYSKRSSSNSSLILKEKFPPDTLCTDEDEQLKDPAPVPRSMGIASWDQDQILVRARQMLSTLEENIETSDVTKRMIRKTARKKDLRPDSHSNMSRDPAAMATPHRQQFQRLGVLPDEPNSKNILASKEILLEKIVNEGQLVVDYIFTISSKRHETIEHVEIIPSLHSNDMC